MHVRSLNKKLIGGVKFVKSLLTLSSSQNILALLCHIIIVVNLIFVLNTYKWFSSSDDKSSNITGDLSINMNGTIGITGILKHLRAPHFARKFEHDFFHCKHL